MCVRNIFVFVDLWIKLRMTYQGWSNVLMQIASWQNPAHWSRNLHALICRWNLSLPISIGSVQCPCFFQGKTSVIPWPIILLSSWIKTIFKKTRGSLLMNGFDVDDEQHELQLSSFWQLYKYVVPNHPVFSTHGNRLHRVIPLYYHGDEGRGKLRRPVLITSYVAGLPARGHSFLSRFLAAVFPGERYAVGPDGVETLQALHQALSQDLLNLFSNGFDVTASECTMRDVAWYAKLILNVSPWFGESAR